jgi:hypothetical protein
LSNPKVIFNIRLTAESIAINLLKLESANFAAIKQSNILEKHVNTQLPSRTKHQEFPKIIYKKGASKDLEENNIENTNNPRMTYND